MKPEVKVIKRLDRRPQNRATIPADRHESLLRTIEHMEAQAGRLLKMVRDVKVALTETSRG